MNDDVDAVDKELDEFVWNRPDMAERRANAAERGALRVHQRMIEDWARRDDGPIPTFADAVTVAHAEIDVLCEALGDLADYLPSAVFYRSPRGKPRDESM